MTTQGAGFCKAERTGRNNNIITPEGSSNGRSTGVAELSSHEDLEEAQLSEDEVVVELEEGGKIRELDEEERFIKVKTDSLSSDRLEKFFTDEEIEELQEKKRTLTGDSEPEKDIDEVWENIREGVRKHNKEVAKNKKELEKKRLKEAYRDPALDKKMKNMTGEQMQRVMSDDSSSTVDEEELQKSLAEVDKKYESMLNESEPEINDPSNEIEELDKGLEAWREKGESKPYWYDFVEDLEQSREDTMYESVGPNSKRVTTQDSELKQALRNPEDEPNWTGSVELVEDSGSTVIAVVSED
ncbi:hypothetical protein [Halorubrum salinum]|uniref:hypothetical protein n=1 Tax=Halorubrum salinum TaxID=767517 RepID=UPI0021116046|nr:hypothetical protein [Halorubrum salinum]